MKLFVSITWLAFWVVLTSAALYPPLQLAVTWPLADTFNAQDFSISIAGFALPLWLETILRWATTAGVGLLFLYLSTSDSIAPLTRFLLRLVAFLLITLAAIDGNVLTTFALRLQLEDIPAYLSIDNSLVMFGLDSWHILGIFSLLTGIFFFLAFLFLWPINLEAKWVAWPSLFLIVWVVGGIVAELQSSSADPNGWIKKSTLATFVSRPLDKDFALNSSLPPNTIDETCATSQNMSSVPKTTVLLIVESLTNGYSEFFSKHGSLHLADSTQSGKGNSFWMNNLDEWTSKGRVYTNFWSNGFNTYTGLIPLLKGDLPLTPPTYELTPRLPILHIAGTDGKRGFIPMANANGWRVRFLSTFDLDTFDQISWYRQLGMREFSGGENPFYDDWPRFIFNSTGDEALFKYALQEIKQSILPPQILRQPSLTIIKTASAHAPFVNPETGQRDLEGTFRYVDHWLGWFLGELEEIDFYSNGMLIVTGDHRASTFPNAAEGQNDGWASLAKVPLLVFHDSIRPEIVSTPFQQLDLYNSFRSMVSGSSCTHPLRGDVFEGNAPRCTTNAFGGDRSLVIARCSDANAASRHTDFREGLILLDAEATRQISGTLTPDEERMIVDLIQHTRLTEDFESSPD